MCFILCVFFVLICHVDELSALVKGSTDSVLISYDGEPADIEVKLGLKYRRKVLRRYEFFVPSSTDIDQLIESHPELKIEKLTYQHRTKRAVSISDAQWSNQWQLQTSQSPSMNVYNAWDKGFTGSGITIAIVDDGIDIDHSDLSDNYNAALSYDIIYDSEDPSHIGPDDGHGTNCAGVAAGVKNTLSIVGVAYQASIAAIRILDDTYSSTEADEALELTYKLANIDIYSNSWGPSDDGETFSGLSDIQRDALQMGVTEGRGGKGAIYSWASGNGGDYDDDCNADGYSSSIYTIAIAAVSETTGKTWYSEHCTAIHAATYSGDSPNAQIVTTGPGNTCVNDFTGTSSACPLASGIFALTLQANSDLTWRDIQHMLVEYSISSGLHAEANFYTNAAGKKVSHWFGFGLMDAEAMVDNAPSWKTVPSSTSCSSIEIDVNIDSVTTSIVSIHTASQCFISNLEHVVVSIRYSASRRGNVEFFLESPSGTRSKIFRSRTYDSSSSTITWDFMSVHTWGENPEGDWTLSMSDAIGGTSMTLYYWKIQFYGTVTNPLSGIPAAGEFGSTCTNSEGCSDLTDGGCLENGKICVVCNNGYRIIDIFCQQDGRLGGYCDSDIKCAFSSLECDNNVCKEKQTEEETDKISLIVGAVIGTCFGLILLVTAGYFLYKFCFAAKATSVVTPAPYVRPPVYSLQPPPDTPTGRMSHPHLSSYSNPGV